MMCVLGNWYWYKNFKQIAQSSLNKINAWCNINGFKMSNNQSVSASIYEEPWEQTSFFTLNDQTIEVKHQFKYLGIIFPENGLCNAHVSCEHDKGLKRIDLLRMLKGTNWGLSEDPFLCIYRALIRSMMEYGIKIYFNSSESSLKQIEKIETEYLDMCGS